MNSKYSPEIRTKLLDVTESLIYQYGLQATGMELIVKESGIARKTLYRYFSNKDDLCAQALLRRDKRWMAWFSACSLTSDDARENILNLFSTLKSWFLTESFRGCAFINSAGETAAATHPVRVIAREHKQHILDLTRQLALDAGAQDPDLLARQLLLLIDGAITVAMIMGSPDAADDARETAKILLNTLTTP
ncbi:TetR/AcrR family transcriptional regulator [[Erwinia] mediterraneensis]|uniref:TetR/AcrR family transcriptional regulator n=1 Tax=[Erwinia] mediterraneensis TaxID=2161819 RepID=UPI0010301EB3|nr:TetR/AcrR family transcriptional regulator [[Erwinia] mediterraneensis]